MVSAALYSMGIYGLEIFNPDDYKMPQKDYTWDYIDDGVLQKQNEEAYVCAYIGDAPAGYDQLNEIKGFLSRMPSQLPDFDLGRLEICVTNIQNQAWVNNWKRFFKPMNVGNKFIIVPEWEKADNAEGKLVLTINPGGIFGTGSHETTQLCISAIENAFEQNKNIRNVMDIGTGSGILSIASLLLGAEHTECIDIDPNADVIVKENMDFCSLTPLAERAPEDLSVGEKKRTAVAAVMAMGTNVIVFDEPTTGLTWSNLKSLLPVIERLNAQGRTVIMITHNIDLVVKYGARIAVVLDGRIAFDGGREALFSNDELLKKAHLTKPAIFDLSQRLSKEYGIQPCFECEELTKQLMEMAAWQA